MNESIHNMQLTLMEKQQELEEFQLSCLSENNLQFEKVIYI